MSHGCRAHNTLCKGNGGVVCGDDQVKKLNTVSMSNNTIRRQVDDMAEDILAQMIDVVKCSQVLSSI